MQDTSRFGARHRQEHGEHGYEPREINGSGASLWVATAVVIVFLAGLSLFGHDKLTNGGAPFVITPPSQSNVGSQNGF